MGGHQHLETSDSGVCMYFLQVRVYVPAHISVCMCVHVRICMHWENRGFQCLLQPLCALCISRQGLSLNLEFTESPTLPNQWAPGICLSLCPSTGVKTCVTASAWCVGARIQTEVLRACVASALLTESYPAP